ncbi:hypothetical protein ABNQ39_26725 [Azospirillum sp. A26]|uniref:hypothetical protein n=1 Tax=Azospirillum sp. A26 TaxID=3160607 RepID=UPI003670A11C
MSSAFLDTLTLLTAVSGRFDPLALLEQVPEPDREEVAGALAALCDEDLSNGAYRWILKSAPRRAALSRLTAPGLVGPTIAEAPPVEAGDLFGKMLRDALRGRASGLGAFPAPGRKGDEGRREQEDEARYAASQFASFTPAVGQELNRSEREDASSRITMRRRLSSLSAVLPNTLFGRDAMTRRLRQHVLTQGEPALPLLVSGEGGLGKSALLANLVRAWMRNDKPPFVVLLDFDRPTLSGGHPIDVMQEFLRQLGAEYLRAGHAKSARHQTAADALHALRNDLSEATGPAADRPRPTIDAEFSVIQSLVLGQITHRVPPDLRAMPIAFVMDSFESVGNLGPETVKALLDLEERLRADTVFPGLRAIVSGRGIPLPERQAVDRFGPRKRWLTVGPLPVRSGAALLEQRDRVNAPNGPRFPRLEQRVRAARALQGHPLALIVLERFARQQSEDEIDALLRDIETDQAFSAEFAQTFLYSRILDRISDPDVQKLAHPGLVLRRINVDLIRLVLAGPCLGRSIDLDEAESLLSRLAAHYWLVEPTGEAGVVRHRPDLRRLMLRQIFAGPRRTDGPAVVKRKEDLQRAAKQVNLEAVRFYKLRPDDGASSFWESLNDRQRAVEVAYHGALAGGDPPAPLPFDLAADLRAMLGDDLETLPVAWRAVVKATLGAFSGLTDADLQHLPGDLRAAAFSALSRRSLERGDTEVAARHIRSETENLRSPFPEGLAPSAFLSGGERPSIDPDRLDRQVLSAFDAVDFDRVREVGYTLLEIFIEHGDTADDTRKKVAAGRLWEAGLWKAALCWGVRQDHRRTRDLVERLRDSETKGWHTDGRPTYFLIASLLNGAQFGYHVGCKDFRWQNYRAQKSLDVNRTFAGLISANSFAMELWTSPSPIASNWLSLAGAWVGDAGKALHGRDDNRNIFGIPGGALRDFIQARSSGARFSTAELARLYGNEIGLSVEFPDGKPLRPREMARLLDILRGLTPELHTPLAQCIGGNEDRANGLLARLAERAQFWPQDLLPGKNRYTKRDDFRIIETADRCGALDIACDFLGKQNSTAEDLWKISKLISARLFTPTD